MLTDRALKSLGPSKSLQVSRSRVVAPRNPKLVREEKKKGAPLTPSAFLREMSLTTEQKLANTHEMHRPRIVQLLDMSETSHQKFSSVDLDQTLFQPFPSEIIFQNYSPCELYEVPLTLRNTDKIPRLVKVVLESSPYFRVISPNDVCNKVAPGMPSTFRILFTPEENKDYFHEVTCITEREKFIVPIRAIGARGILDFPDQLNFALCPVKYNTQKTLHVRNIGNREARYQITTQRPFSVQPSIGTLGVEETTQFVVEFQPQMTGSHGQDLVVHYDTGEDIHVSLYGAATDVNVRLDKNSLIVEKTYITLANQRSVVIHNRSNIIVHFQWKAFATPEEEGQKKQTLCHALQAEESCLLDQLLAECNVNPALREHLAIVTRTFHNRQTLVQEDALLFNNHIFTVEPLEGDVWPNSTAEVNVIFRPQEAGIYQHTVYCDITGRESRLPLRIKGEAMGPKVLFNFDQLDIGKVFIGSTHSYEAILSNEGAIDALFNLTWPPTALACCFAFRPSEGIIEPGSHQAILITFSSSLLGHFSEEFKLLVNGSPQPVSLVIRGCVIGPTFHFNVPSLNFGDVSFGFPRTLSCCLSNTSLVPMTFNLHIPGDGSGRPSVTSQDQALDISKPTWRKSPSGGTKPREFTITPSRGTIRSQAVLDIKVTLCSNTVKTYETALVVDVKGSGEDVLALPITARCHTPHVYVANPIVNFGRCFLKYPYQRVAKLVNESDLPGCYGVLPQESERSPTIVHSSPSPCGVIPPHSSVEIPIVLEVQETGRQDVLAQLAVFGNQDLPLMIQLVGIGEGPVVHVHPGKLDFGNIQVLTDVSRMLYLSNQSIIPAPFEAQMTRARSLWRIEPSQGTVPPEAEISLTLMAHLDDTVLFEDKVNLHIENSNSYIIPVQATGIGTTIVTDKPFAPAIDLGPHFSLDPCRYRFTLTNRGRRTHQLYWMTEGFPPFRQRNNSLPAMGTRAKAARGPKAAEPQFPVFKLQPLRMELTPGRSMEMSLEGSSDTPKVIKERLICHAIIGKQSGKECIMKVDVTCEFIAPVLQLSCREITFRVEKNPGDILTAQYEPLSLKNVSSLPLSVLLSLQEPFSLCDTNHKELPVPGQPLKMDVGEVHHLCVRFDPIYRDDLYNRVAEEVLTLRYLEHPHVDHIGLRGEVHFPNLDFQTTHLDFGCILNDTEVVHEVDMTNCSPLLIKYHWSFQSDDEECLIRFSPRGAQPALEQDAAQDAGVSSQSEPCRDGNSSRASMREAAVEENGDKAEVEDASQTETTVEAPERSDAKEEPSLSATEEEAEEEVVEEEEEEGTPQKTQVEAKEVLWSAKAAEPHVMGVEEVFDIQPLFGLLQPKETQKMTFTFYGHADIVAQVKALCQVEGGPTYQVSLHGEASVVSYAFDRKEIDYGLQLFDHISVAEITLRNTGKVAFEYSVLDAVKASADNPLPGVPLTLPVISYIESGKEQVLRIYYLPGVPEVFYRTFRLQVAHLEPDSITLKGEGIFPRICLDLPRNLRGNEQFVAFLREAKQLLESESQKDFTSSSEAVGAEPPPEESAPTMDTQLLMEVERLLVREHALEQQRLLAEELWGDPAACQRMRRKLVKAQLPEYILDFGYIIMGTVRSHIVKITNTSQFPVSFHADVQSLQDTGFSTGLDRVKNLPFCETETFEVLFDPQSGNRPLGEVEVLLPIKVVFGPTLYISLRAMVIMPSLCMSNDNLEFAAVQCGQCQVETIQLHNQLQVVCEWFATSSEQMKKVDKRMPASLRRKMRQELRAKPPVFEMVPPYGILAPGERLNVQVKFVPREEKFYRNYLMLSISQSTHQLKLNVSGQGLEPRLEFQPSILELGPLLPYAAGDEAEVVVRNPCSFPIEFYSLEFDQQYLLEERILRMLKGYDSHNILLLPPRIPGEKLTPEVLEYYEEQKKVQGDVEASVHQDNEEEETIYTSEHTIKPHPSSTAQVSSLGAVSLLPSLSLHDESRTLRADSRLEQEEEEEEEGTEKGPGQVGSQHSFTKHKEAVGELDNNPVSKAIARHLGIDISPEGRAARNRRGIAIIVHGAPLTGKTSAAVTLAKHYSAACLSIDSVVLEAISDGSTSAGLHARELCIRAAIELTQRENEEGGPEGQPTLSAGTRMSLEVLTKRPSDGSQQSSESKTGPLSTLSRGYRGSTATAKGKPEGHTSQKQQQQHQQQPSDLPGSQVPSSPIPSAPTQRRLSLSLSVAGDVGLMSCVLPEELLVEILSERMQLSDCYRGMVFDGLETLFARSMLSALLCLLKAINNRRYIYFVNLSQDFAAMKAVEKSKQEQAEWEEQEALSREKARLQEMDEEGYDGLTEEQRVQFDREVLQALRERKKREQEKLARELEEKKHQQELERLREEEEMKKKSKRYKKEAAKEKEEPQVKKGQQGKQSSSVPVFKSDGRLNEGIERKTSARERPEAGANEDRKKKNRMVLQNGQLGLAQVPVPEEEEAEKDAISESEKALAHRFKLYEANQKDILQVLMFWDRAQLVQLQLPGSEEKPDEAEDQRQPTSGRKGRKDRERERQERLEKERLEKERLEKERLERERLERLKALEENWAAGQEGEGGGEGAEKDVGIPYLEIQVLSSEDTSGKRILESGKLPDVVEILDGLGLGPAGPPIPPTAFFSAIPYPEKRLAFVPGEALKHFTFIVPEELILEEERKEADTGSDTTSVAVSNLPIAKEDQGTPVRGKSRKEKGDPARDTSKEKKSGVRGKKSAPLSPGTVTTLSELDQGGVTREPSMEKLQKLSTFRWTVPANGEVTIRLHFSSTTTGHFDQVLNFEILGTRRQYQVCCRGTCTYPTICRDPTVVFPHRMKTLKPEEIVFKKYIMSLGVFHFGPLLCGKSRERYKAARYPNHCEKITILNNSPLEAEVHFFFQYDSKAITYLLDPPSLTLKPNEAQVLTIWAYPTASGIFEDSIICCVKENPEPVTFRLCCQGVRPELELDRRQLHFEKLLLHRKETRSLFLKNFTPLPVAWRISGLENIGDDFSLSDDMGVIAPFSEYCLLVNFKANKPLNIKKVIRLEVSDSENIMGIMQIENIQIVAEAYDVALDISFPKGTNGSLEFGTVRIMDEAKQILSMKNKGKYEIAYNFAVEATDHRMPNPSPFFSFQPRKGNLGPNERPAQVQIMFRARKEVRIEDKPILQCHVIEPNISEGGEVIATIPIRVSVHSAFSKYNIVPPALINFGPVLSGSRKTSTFTIENKGHLDFKFGLFKQARDLAPTQRKGNSRSREAELGRQYASQATARHSKHGESLQRDINLVAQARFSVGMFSISPGFGTVPPGGQQAITVECIADQVGKCEEYLTVEVMERDPEDSPGGITYTLVAESCIPGFVTDQAGTIFEEHRICSRKGLGQVLKLVSCEGVFVTDENRFLFCNVLVGHQASARFKICNTGRIPCDVLLAIKPISAKSAVRVTDIFELQPVRMSVASRSHAFATLTFTPQSLHNYQCMFEASVDAVPSVASKCKTLSFEVSGDGNLPRITIVKPVLCNKKGHPLLLFRRLLLGRTEALPLVLRNSGKIGAQLHLDLSDEYGAFSLQPRPSTCCAYLSSQNEESDSGDGVRQPHTASLILRGGEVAEFEVTFQPGLPQRIKGQIRLSIVDNQYEETNVQLVGEGYQDDITLDHIHSLVAESEVERGEAPLQENATGEVARTDCLQFGDCHVGKPYQATFTITNHSKSDAMRFEWLPLNPFLFSPQVGHLHAGCAKNILLTLKASLPLTLQEQPLKCKVSKILFPLPAEQVPDWDDRLHTVKWVEVPKTTTTPAPRPARKKVVETDPEPAHLVVEESSREVELRVSATVDYAQCRMEVDTIHFKDTLLFQTRVFEVELFNTGNVRLEYTWKVTMEDPGRAVNFDTEPLATSAEGDLPSGTSATSLKLQSSRPISRTASALESFSSYLFPAATSQATFLLEPQSGTVPAGKSSQLQVKFSPQEVGEFEGRLACRVSNMKPDEEGPVLAVKGKSLLPYCHFELEDSDYITANRRNPDVRGGPGGMGLDPNTKVIEFTSVGVHVRITKSFGIINPTNTPYSFQWTCEQQEEGQEHPAFICFTERGYLRPEKTLEVIFEFIPQHLDVTESSWTFTIPEVGLSVPFLLVGHATDPDVSLDRSHLNFRSLLVGHEAHETFEMINGEEEAYSFSFRESSRYSEGRINSLRLEPMEGSVPPQSRLPITAFLTPTLEGEINFNLICDIKSKSQPLDLNVKATGHVINVAVKCEESDGSVNELSPDQPNPVHFHEIQVNNATQCSFYLLNTGKFNCHYAWEFHNAKAVQRYFVISPEAAGVVEAGERAEMTLSFHPLKVCTLKGVELQLQISQGPTFTCALQGSVLAPTLLFSFTKVDFGKCFLYHAGMPVPKRVLTITNKDTKGTSLECLFSNLPHLEVVFHTELLSPGGTLEVPISFYPKEAMDYHEVITFEISGLLRKNVDVFGMGIEMKIDVVEPRNKVMKLGAVPPGHTVKKTAKIANNSIAPVTCTLNFVSCVPELQENKVLTMSPSGEVTLTPKGGTCLVEVTFAPKGRVLPFTEEVLFDCQGVLRSLFMVQGCSQGIEISLDQSHVPFGAVVLKSQASRRITLQNTGDIGVGFKWEAKRFKPDFSIRPVEGYLSPGMDVSFEVTFHPCKESQDIRYENIPCHIQGQEPIQLTLSGCCVELAPVKEVVNFTCQVRARHTQTIMLTNRTTQPWRLRPIIEGEQWKGPEFIRVEAHQQNKPYEITYRPLAMNLENKKDQGSIFFPLPDGTGLLYQLQGTAEPPKSAGNIIREVPCKTSYTELFPVANWLNKPQRFRVTIDMLKPEKLELTTTLKTLDYVEVPASAKKDHKVTFFSYREGMYTAKVTFRNEVTQEFLFYVITFKAIPCGPLGTIEMTAAVRQSVSSSVKVENPLHSAVTFITDCKVPDINIPPQFVVPAQSEGVLVFDFQPMRPGESGGRLAFNSNELGSFQYDLVLKATPAWPEKPLTFCTTLGSSQSLVTKFVNYTRLKTEYSTKIDCPDFHVDKVINAPAGSLAGSDVSLEVTFEPCQLGESKGTLTLSSPIGGDYAFPLSGTSLPPKPQGPIQIKAGTSTNLSFKNVFTQPMAFTYIVESPAFTVRATETIRPKKTATVTVSFEGNPSGHKAPVTSKLVISCPRAAGLSSGVSWVYYLKGIVPEK